MCKCKGNCDRLEGSVVMRAQNDTAGASEDLSESTAVTVLSPPWIGRSDTRSQRRILENLRRISVQPDEVNSQNVNIVWNEDRVHARIVWGRGVAIVPEKMGCPSAANTDRAVCVARGLGFLDGSESGQMQVVFEHASSSGLCIVRLAQYFDSRPILGSMMSVMLDESGIARQVATSRVPILKVPGVFELGRYSVGELADLAIRTFASLRQVRVDALSARVHDLNEVWLNSGEGRQTLHPALRMRLRGAPSTLFPAELVVDALTLRVQVMSSPGDSGYGAKLTTQFLPKTMYASGATCFSNWGTPCPQGETCDSQCGSYGPIICQDPPQGPFETRMCIQPCSDCSEFGPDFVCGKSFFKPASYLGQIDNLAEWCFASPKETSYGMILFPDDRKKTVYSEGWVPKNESVPFFDRAVDALLKVKDFYYSDLGLSGWDNQHATFEVLAKAFVNCEWDPQLPHECTSLGEGATSPGAADYPDRVILYHPLYPTIINCFEGLFDEGVAAELRRLHLFGHEFAHMFLHSLNLNNHFSDCTAESLCDMFGALLALKNIGEDGCATIASWCHANPWYIAVCPEQQLRVLGSGYSGNRYLSSFCYHKGDQAVTLPEPTCKTTYVPSPYDCSILGHTLCPIPDMRCSKGNKCYIKPSGYGSRHVWAGISKAMVQGSAGYTSTPFARDPGVEFDGLGRELTTTVLKDAVLSAVPGGDELELAELVKSVASAPLVDKLYDTVRALGTVGFVGETTTVVQSATGRRPVGSWYEEYSLSGDRLFYAWRDPGKRYIMVMRHVGDERVYERFLSSGGGETAIQTFDGRLYIAWPDAEGVIWLVHYDPDGTSYGPVSLEGLGIVTRYGMDLAVVEGRLVLVFSLGNQGRLAIAAAESVGGKAITFTPDSWIDFPGGEKYLVAPNASGYRFGLSAIGLADLQGTGEEAECLYICGSIDAAIPRVHVRRFSKTFEQTGVPATIPDYYRSNQTKMPAALMSLKSSFPQAYGNRLYVAWADISSHRIFVSIVADWYQTPNQDYPDPPWWFTLPVDTGIYSLAGVSFLKGLGIDADGLRYLWPGTEGEVMQATCFGRF